MDFASEVNHNQGLILTGDNILLLECFILCSKASDANIGIQGFPKIDHSGISARIGLEQNKFSKKATSNKTKTLNPRTVVLTSCVQFHALPTVPIPIA